MVAGKLKQQGCRSVKGGPADLVVPVDFDIDHGRKHTVTTPSLGEGVGLGISQCPEKLPQGLQAWADRVGSWRLRESGQEYVAMAPYGASATSSPNLLMLRGMSFTT